MPNISQRGVNMPESPIRKLVPLANKAKARGIKVYHLNIGQPDLPTPGVAMDAMRRIDRKVLEYSPSEGIRSFREKLVAYYAKFGINVNVDDIIITTGGSEAVFFSFMACLDPGDEIIVPEPAYANYMAFAIPGSPSKPNQNIGATTPSLRFSANVSRAAARISSGDKSAVSRPTMRLTCLRPSSMLRSTASKTALTSAISVVPAKQ